MIEKKINQQLYWTKDVFSLNYSIYKDAEIAGVINDKSTNRSANASIQGREFVFESNGFLKPSITIIDLNKKKEIGTIDFKVFRTKANIHIYDDNYLWQLDNIMGTKWSLRDSTGDTKISADNRTEGYCKIKDEETPFLLVVSLIIRNHFTKQGY